jgi:hypothetical protein
MHALAAEPGGRTALAIIVQDRMARLAMSALAQVAAIAARRANRAAVDGPLAPRYFARYPASCRRVPGTDRAFAPPAGRMRSASDGTVGLGGADRQSLTRELADWCGHGGVRQLDQAQVRFVRRGWQHCAANSG